MENTQNNKNNNYKNKINVDMSEKDLKLYLDKNIKQNTGKINEIYKNLYNTIPKDLNNNIDRLRDYLLYSMAAYIQEDDENKKEIESLKREFSNIYNNFDNQLSEERNKLKRATIELEQKLERNSKEYQDKITNSSNEFLGGVVDALKKREEKLNDYSRKWSYAGFICLVIALILVCLFSMFDAKIMTSSWEGFIYYCVRGLAVVGIIGFLSRYSFMQSGNFMKEALKTDDRIHNIKFGQLYIVTYGASAEWKEVKEALSNWNGKIKQDWKQKIKFDELTETLNAVSVILKNNESSLERKEK